MDIGAINSNLNVNADQPGFQPNKLSMQNQAKKANFQQQFKAVSKKEEVHETQKTVSEVSTNASDTTNPQKNSAAQTLKNIQQLIIKPEAQEISTPKANVLEVLQDTQLNKLKQQNQTNKNNLQNKLLGEKGASTLRGMALSSSSAMFQSWLKKIKRKSGTGDEIEDIDEALFSDDNNETGAAGNQQSQKIKTNSLVQQQKLFSLNMQSSMRYLKNLRTFNQRYSPEMLIYDDDTGYVDAQETLECLGWDGIEQFKTKLQKELNLKGIKEIHGNDKIMNAANKAGLNVYKAKHPLHNDKTSILAIESLTGDITMINNLQDLEKLELQGKVYNVYQVAK